MPNFESFTVEVADEAIEDLRRRLTRTRWPDQIPGSGWDYGTDLGTLRDLCAHWADGYDWDGFLARANAHPQFTTTIDGQRIHFVHARSPEAEARPLLLTHGWPGSVAEFYEVIGPLSDPVAHGGDAADAFHVVCPSLPGYGFSGPTVERGWDVHRIARAWAELMSGLGYDRFFAQGGDWGSPVTISLAGNFPDRVAAVHVNMMIIGRPRDVDDPMAGVTEAEREALARSEAWRAEEAGYQSIQGTKPQTLAYGLTDSPAGLAGWILEKFQSWSDCGGDVLGYFGRDRLLDNISIYWLTGTINSSMRLYYESLGPGRLARQPKVTVPVGYTRYPGEMSRPPRAWAEARFDIFSWAEQERGGHFAAMELPGVFVDDVRACFRAASL
jgi:microsomal epoxide hydrolase